MFRPPIRPDASEAVALPFDTILDLLPADDAPAIIGTEGRRPLTFSRLISQSRGLNLSKFGIGPTDRVAVAIPNGPEAASALLAFTYACAYAPLNPRLTHAELAFELEDLPAKAVVVQRGERELNNGRIIEVARAMRLSILELVPSTAEAGAWELHSLDASTPMPRGAHLWHSHKPVQAGGAAASILEPATCAGVPVRSAARVAPVANAETEEGHDETEAANVETESANDVTRAANDKSGATLHRPGDCSRTRRGAVCLLLHTSGTSSKPKLVPLTHQNLGVGASCIAAALQLTRGETSLSIMPLFHIHGISVSVLAALLSGASVIAYPSFVPQTILAHARRGQAAPAGLPAAVPFARDMGAGGRPGAGEGIAAGGEGNAARGVGRVGDAGLGNSARHRCGGDAAAGSEGEQTRSQGGHARSEGAHVLFATDWGSSAPTPPSLAPAAQPSRAWYSAVPTMHLLLLEVAEAEAARAQRSLHGSPLGPPAALPLPRGAASDPLLPSTLEGASVALAAFDATHRHAPCTEGNPGAHLDSSADSHFPASPLAPPTPLYANPAPQAPPPSSPPCPCGLLFIRNCSAALLPSISSRLEAMLGCQVLTTYAMTESMPIAANRRGGGRKLRSVGMSTGPEIRVVRPTQAAAEGEVGDGLAGEGEGAERVGVECAVGEEGEVCVRGGCVTSGYETRPHMQSDPNLSSFYTRLTPAPSQPRLKCSPAECARTPGTGRTPHVSHRLALPSMCSAMRPPSHPPNGGLVGSAAPLANGRWLRTGDRGMVGPDGHLYLSGRFKEIINRAGEKISPFEVEEALRCELSAHPVVKDLLAFSAPHAYLGEVVGVALALAPGTAPADRPTLCTLRSLGRRKLSLKWCPQVLVYFPAADSHATVVGAGLCRGGLPKGPTGKPARIGLAERLSLPTMGASAAAAAAETARPDTDPRPVLTGDARSATGGAAPSLPLTAPMDGLESERGEIDTWEVVGAATGSVGPIEARPWAPVAAASVVDAHTGAVRKGVGHGPGEMPAGVPSIANAGAPTCGTAGVHGEAEVLRQLRLVWVLALQLPAAPEDASDDDVPFGSMGGDSLLGAMMIRLAAQRGVALSHHLAAEMEVHTIRSLAASVLAQQDGETLTAAASGVGEREAARADDHALDSPASPQQDERRHGSPLTPPEEEHARAAAALTSSAATAHLPRSLKIIERDRRFPRMPLTAVGGLTACAVGDVAGAAELLAAGVWDPRHAVDKHGNTALIWAAGPGHMPVVRWLFSVGVAVDGTNKDGRTALMWACKKGQCGMARFLMEEHSADASRRMKDDSTAFDWAVLGGDVPTMELMLKQPSVDVNALNRFGCAAVQWAAAAGNVATCEWLLSKGFDLDHVNDAKHGAVVKAAWKGHTHLLRWFFFDPDGPDLRWQLDVLDLEGRSVAVLARMNGMTETAGWLQELIDERQRGRTSEEGAGAAACGSAE